MYIRKMFSVSDSTPPLSEVLPLMMESNENVTITATGLANGAEHQLTAEITHIQYVRKTTGSFAIKGYLTEEGEQSEMAGIINIDKQHNATAILLTY
jgi:hypothetical protein